MFNNLAWLIKCGIFKFGFKLFGICIIVSYLVVNWNMVVVVFSELEVEGWIYSWNCSGWYINKDLLVVIFWLVNGDLGMACCYLEKIGFVLYELVLFELEY